MDREVPKKKQKTKKILFITLIAFGLCFLLLHALLRKKTTNIHKSEVSIREVVQGKFDDLLIVNGKIEPKNSILINVIEGGAVKELYVEDGGMVTKGQELLKVYNPNAELGFLQQETSMIEQINNLQNTKINLRNQELDLEKELIQIEYDYEEARQQYALDTVLYNSEVLARRDFEKSRENFKYQSKRKNIIRKSVATEKIARAKQIKAINFSLEQMQQSLQTLRKNKENFTVKASASGRVSSFDLAIGENLTSGQSIGKIDILDGYKFEVKVDEYYISRVFKGLEGSIESNAQTYAVVIKKILPEVVNGQFTVELIFKDNVPENLRMGMSFSIKLFLSESSNSLIIPKGQFYSETGGRWIYVLTSNDKAQKRNIELGRENPFFYEVKEGLQIGEKVIVSDYTEFRTNEILNIKD